MPALFAMRVHRIVGTCLIVTQWNVLPAPMTIITKVIHHRLPVIFPAGCLHHSKDFHSDLASEYLKILADFPAYSSAVALRLWRITTSLTIFNQCVVTSFLTSISPRGLVFPSYHDGRYGAAESQISKPKCQIKLEAKSPNLEFGF